LEIHESEVLSLVGESGSGKTTVARCILGLTSPISGTIYYRGADLERIKRTNERAYRREVQIIYQDPFESLNPRLDVFATISLPLRRLLSVSAHDELIERVSELLREVGLDPAASLEKFPHQLSGGERQRINIARALAPNPKLLIADEPVTMLDASQRMNILSMLMELKAKHNLTVLMITHDLASAKVTSDRTVVMYRGRVSEVGPTAAVLSKPIHPYTELILDSTPDIEKGGVRPEETAPGSEVQVITVGGCNFEPRCKYATDVCRMVRPPLEQKSALHYAACHNPLNV
jgi:peptide/nickel transport system ATP-binding protein